MKLTIRAILFCLIAGPVWADDPVIGIWQTEPDEGAYAHIELAHCTGGICGTMIRSFNDSGEYQSSNLGSRIVRDMVPVRAAKYRGKVWRPSNNKLYVGKMALEGDQLELKGCVAGGLICSSQTWQRVVGE